MNRKASLRLIVAFSAASCASLAVAVAEAGEEQSSVSFEQLVFDVQRFGNTPEKKSAKEAAKLELSRRGTNALQVLMGYAHIENSGVQMFTQELVERMKPEESAPVLVGCLSSDHPRTRRLAAYYLGLHETPEYADHVRPLLKDDEACGAAIRTLGKWKVKGASGEIASLVSSTKEQRRIAAINALKDIGDPSAADVLITALNDSYFTVREAAQAALVSLGEKGQGAVLQAAPSAQGRQLRHVIRILGTYDSWRSRRLLKRFASSEDPEVRSEAEAALRRP